MKPSLFIPFNILPEGRTWSKGKSYQVKMTLRETSLSKDGANFEVVSASSLEPEAKMRSRYISEGGYLKA